jgi:hypothetical protein
MFSSVSRVKMGASSVALDREGFVDLSPVSISLYSELFSMVFSECLTWSVTECNHDI